MALYRNVLSNFHTPFLLRKPVTKTVKGVTTKKYEDSITFSASLKVKGKQDTDSNGLTVVQQTIELICWYNPLLTSDCQLVNLETGYVYEIIGDVEDIDGLHQRMKVLLKLKRGGV